MSAWLDVCPGTHEPWQVDRCSLYRHETLLDAPAPRASPAYQLNQLRLSPHSRRADQLRALANGFERMANRLEEEADAEPT